MWATWGTIITGIYVVFVVIGIISIKKWRVRAWIGFGMVNVGALFLTVGRFVKPQWLFDFLFLLVLGIPIGYAVGFFAGVKAGKEEQHKNIVDNLNNYISLNYDSIVDVIKKDKHPPRRLTDIIQQMLERSEK